MEQNNGWLSIADAFQSYLRIAMSFLKAYLSVTSALILATYKFAKNLSVLFLESLSYFDTDRKTRLVNHKT